MADNEYKSNAQADKKQQAKEAKRKQRQEELANIDEIEKYKIEEKAAKRNQKDKVKQEQQKEEKEKKPSVPAKEKGVKKSRPTPARAPFHFFKDDQKGKSEEEIQAAWKAISPEDKKKYTELAKTDREREKQEMKEYNELQEQLKAQKAGKDRKG